MQTAETNLKVSQADTRPAIVFSPHYMGSLRYFEKLLPYVSKKYRPVFLILFTKQCFFSEMAAYCKDKNYEFFLMDEPIMPSFVKRFGALRSVIFARHYVRELPRFFALSSIAKIITVSDSGFYMRHLYMEAKKRGVDCKILQWGLTYPAQKDRPKKIPVFYRRALYRYGKKIYVKAVTALMKFFVDPTLDRTKTVLGGGIATSFGVINRQAYDFFLSKGVPAGKMTVVGSMDFYLAEEAEKEIRRDAGRVAEIQKRFSINPQKKNIILISSPFNIKDLTIFNDTEQYEYTEKNILAIRAVYTEAEADILLKIHPAERIELYQPLEKYGVKLFGKDTNNAELIHAGDLYIADNTNVNFTAIRAGKPAIFINFMNLPVVERSADYFGIRRFVHSREEFEERLSDFKRGNLQSQYEFNEEIFTKNSLEKILAWIG